MKIFHAYSGKYVLIILIIAALSFLATASPGLNLTKTCNVISASVNDTIIYTFNLNNNGTEEIVNPVISDDQLGMIIINKSTLNPKESYTISVPYMVKGSDLPGPLINQARAKAVYNGADVFSNNATCAVSLGVSGFENMTKYGYIVPDLLNGSMGQDPK